MNKQVLRERMRRYRPGTNECWVECLRFWNLLQDAEKVLAFLPLKDEPDTLPLIRWMQEQQKQVYVPRCKNNSGEMEAVLLNGDSLTLDAQGILSSEGEAVSPCEIDLILVPGLAFDPNGNRLGRGKGFYDRYLADDFSGTTCGICPAMRFVPCVPVSEHDYGVDFVFTPYGLFKTNDKKVIE